MKKATLLFVLISISLFGAGGSSRGDDEVKSLPPQGLYDSCEPSTEECRSHLDKIAKAGFKLVINYGVFDYDVADIISYANHAATVGIKVIWDMSSRPYRDGTFDRDYIRERVDAVKTRPATWGYYVADEPGNTTPLDTGSEQGAVKVLSDYVHQLDPAHPRFLVHWYEDDPVGPLRPYVDSADVFAVDVYPLASCSDSRDVEATAKASQELADKTDRQWAIVLQSFDGAQYKKEIPDACPGWPDRERLLKERNLALKNSYPVFILWYSYFDILKSSDSAGHWADLVAAAFSDKR